MKNLKFRAWDKEGKEMLDVHGINFDENGIWTKESIDDEDDGEFIFFDDIILMQSTGSLDQHNVEIYEGDIVNVYVFTVGGSYDGAIESEDTYKKAIITYNRLEDVGFYEWCIKTKDFEFSFGSIEGLREESFEVIGNIYENPELLKEE